MLLPFNYYLFLHKHRCCFIFQGFLLPEIISNKSIIGREFFKCLPFDNRSILDCTSFMSILLMLLNACVRCSTSVTLLTTCFMNSLLGNSLTPSFTWDFKLSFMLLVLSREAIPTEMIARTRTPAHMYRNFLERFFNSVFFKSRVWSIDVITIQCSW